MKDRIAVVTGASSGIGLALTQGLLDAGAHVIGIGRDAQRLSQASSESARTAASHFVGLVADLGDYTQLRRAGEMVRHGNARVHLLVHCAGHLALGAPSLFNPAELDVLYQVNLRAPLLLTQELRGPLMTARGHVVFVNSTAIAHPRPENAVYASTKAALQVLANGLREEFQGRVRVTSIFPARTDTAMHAQIMEYAGARQNNVSTPMSPAAVAASILSVVGMDPAVTATDVWLRPSPPPNG
jgi:short-subunit dehydrogenase